MSSDEPVKSEELTAKLKSVLEKRPEVVEIIDDNELDFRVTVKDYPDPIFMGMQSDVGTLPEIGYYQLVASVGSNNLSTAKSFVFQMGKTVEQTIDSFFKDFNKKKTNQKS